MPRKKSALTETSHDVTRPDVTEPEPIVTSTGDKTMSFGSASFDDGEEEVIDFTKIKDQSELPDEDHDYVATVVHAQVAKSKEGNTKIDLRWRIDEGEFEGVPVFDFMSFAAGAKWRTKQTLMGVGFPDNYSGTPREIAQELLGQSAVITVGLDEQNNRRKEPQIDPATGEPYPPRKRVKAVRPVGSQTSVANALDD